MGGWKNRTLSLIVRRCLQVVPIIFFSLLVFFGTASAEVVYTYTGSNFTDFGGNGLGFDTSDSVTMIMRVNFIPPPNSVYQFDMPIFWVNGAESDRLFLNSLDIFIGGRSVYEVFSTDGLTQTGEIFFDSSGNVDRWGFSFGQFRTESGRDYIWDWVYGYTEDSWASTSQGGDWSREPNSVPEPSTILMLVSGLAGVIGFNRRRH